MKSEVSHLILESLLFREDYSRTILPHIKEEYFETIEEQVIFNKIKDYTQKYSALPTLEVLSIDCNNDPNVTDNTIEWLVEFSKDVERIDKSIDWLVETTEQFCKDRALFNALEESISIAQGIESSTGLSRGALPKIFQDALNVSFDQKLGHDYINDSEERYDFYHNDEERLSLGLVELDKITGGGVPNKTLNVAMGSSGSGKTLFLCSLSSYWLTQGKNVLYITLEMSEERIAERIDANLMNVEIQDMKKMSKEVFDNNIRKISKNTTGRLKIKEYPTGAAGVGHFRFAIEELKQKEDFIPDVICVDYINICSSARVKNAQANSYTIVKSIAEELRGLAVEFNLPIFSLTQTGRSGFDASDIGATDVSESIGLVQTVDMLLGLISNDDLKASNQIIIKTVKNSRYGEDGTFHTIGIDRAKMKLYDIEDGSGSMFQPNQTKIEPESYKSERTAKKFSGLIV
jgi:replicative DNA helicase